MPLSRVCDATVRVSCRHSFPDVTQPWQRERQLPSSASGFAIAGRRIVTNAHAVEHATLLQVRRRDRGRKYLARVLALAPECDLAVLEVDDEAFWEALPLAELGPLPHLDEDVKVIGYPVGGDTMSITAGVVSRIEMQTYAQASAELLAVQIDAAINPGNSGGPVVDDLNRVVGVAFQSLVDADVENCGYVIPAEIVAHLLEDLRRHGKYTGFPGVGVGFQRLESPFLRRYVGLEDSDDEEQLGVIVTHVEPGLTAVALGDVLTAVDGLPVAADGSIPFPGRPGERVSVRHHFCRKFVGETVVLDAFRDGVFRRETVALEVRQSLAPHHWGSEAPPYAIAGGLVFAPLSRPYLEALQEDGVESEDDGAGGHYGHFAHLLDLATFESPTPERREVVVLTQVLAHESNVGYLGLEALKLEKVNGVAIRSLEHLVGLLAGLGVWDAESGGPLPKGAERHLVFEFYKGGIIVLDTRGAQAATREVCDEQGINEPLSPGLRHLVRPPATVGA